MRLLKTFSEIRHFQKSLPKPLSGVRCLSLIIMLLWAGGCAYYNTLYNAKNSYNEGLKVVRENPDQQTTPAAAKKHFEATIDKCWKLIEIYSDNSKYADDALLYISKSEYHLEKYTQSKLHLEQFIRKYSESKLIPEARLWYGKTLLKEEDVEAANDQFLLVINESKDGKIRSQASFELGVYAFEKENYEQSIQYLETALKEKLDDEYKALVVFYLGESYFIQKDYDQAIKQYKKVEKFSPTPDVEYKAKLHQAKSYNALGKFKDADRILRRMLTALRFQPFLPVIKTALGENFESQGKLEDAMDIYREVIRERKPSAGTAQAAFNLAQIFETTYNNIDSAVTYYGKVEPLYRNFDSLEVAKNKKIFLSEFKEIRDQIRYDEDLSFRLTNDPDFRDSLYQAQYVDSLRIAGGIKGEETAPREPSQYLPASGDTLSQAFQDSVANALLDSLNEASADSVDQQQQGDEDIFVGFRGQDLQEPAGTPPENQTNENQQQNEEPKKPLEKRKLPRIEFDLMNSRYQLAEFYLLKVEDFDSAAYYYHDFLEVYEDSILSPKALYSLVYIYKSPGHENPEQVSALEKEILDNYPNSVFAREILKSKGLLIEEASELTPEDEARQLFLEAESLYYAGKINQSLDTYHQVAVMDTSWKISAQALYATAWIYEHDLASNDAALDAYRQIIDRYPTATEYVTIARKKTAPLPPEVTKPAEESHSLLTSTGEDSLGVAAAAPAPAPRVKGQGDTEIVSDITLEQKIRWRNRRQSANQTPLK